MSRYKGLLEQGEETKKQYLESRRKFISDLERKHEEDQQKKRASRLSHQADLLEQAHEKRERDFEERELNRKTPVSGLADYLTDPQEVKRRIKLQKTDMHRTLQSQMTEKRMKKKVLSEAELERDIETINQVNMDNRLEMERSKMVS